MNRDQLLNLTLTDLSFKELLALFKRRKWVVIGTILFALAGGAAVSLLLPPTYRAQSVIIVEGKTQVNPSINNTVVDAITSSGLSYDVMTQIQIMESFQILYSGLKRINYPLPDKIDQQVYESLPKVSVNQIQTTNTVAVAVEYKKDTITQDLAAAIPQVYSDYVSQIQKDDVKRSYDFVTARIDEERKNVQTQQQELANWKVEKGVGDSKSETDIRTGALAEAQRLLAAADGDVVAGEAAVQETASAFANAPKTIDNPIKFTQNDVIAKNKETLNLLVAQREAVLVNNYEDSDRVKRLDAQIKEQRAVLAGLESASLVNSPNTQRNPALDDLEKTAMMARASLQGAIARRESVRQLVEQRKKELRELAPITSDQQQKEVKISETEQTIQKLLDIQNSIRLRDNSLPNPIRDLTGKPTALLVRPIIAVNLALAGLVGLVLGTVFALARDLMLDRVNNSNEACIIAEKEILGRIPQRASGRSPLIADPQRARAFESYRILRTSVMLAKGDAKAIVVTSSISKEGKSTVAANLAVALALDGKRTVLVEGNLRKPAVHKLFKVDQAKGVSEVLGGSLSLDDALKTTETENLAILTAGQEVANPTELVSSEAMKDLVEKLKLQADIIIVDAASAYGYADTQSILANIKDVLFIVEMEAPTKSQMREAVGMIDFAGGNILGVVINKDKWSETRTRGAT